MSTEAMNKTSKTTARTSQPMRFGTPSLAIVITTLAILFGAAIYAGVAVTAANMDAKRAAFENVLKISSDELKGKSVAELSGYRKDILGASEYSLAFGNISGYDESVVSHELNQINELILQKLDR